MTEHVRVPVKVVKALVRAHKRLRGAQEVSREESGMAAGQVHEIIEKHLYPLAAAAPADERTKDPYQLPLARAGEQQFACVLRNRSGIDSGRIDFDAHFIDHLSEGDQQDAVSAAYAIYAKWCHETGKRAPAEPTADDELARLLTAAYSAGYGRGHDATVEGCYVDLKPVDEETYFLEDVTEWYEDRVRVREGTP